MAQEIDPNNIDGEIEKLNGWKKTDSPPTIHKPFKFKDFKEAFKFMTSCAAYAEKIGHHPDWRNVYNKLDVKLTTHDTKNLSNLDILMAQYMDELEAALTKTDAS